jgi:hypothetical protein
MKSIAYANLVSVSHQWTHSAVRAPPLRTSYIKPHTGCIQISRRSSIAPDFVRTRVSAYDGNWLLKENKSYLRALWRKAWRRRQCCLSAVSPTLNGKLICIGIDKRWPRQQNYLGTVSRFNSCRTKPVPVLSSREGYRLHYVTNFY